MAVQTPSKHEVKPPDLTLFIWRMLLLAVLFLFVLFAAAGTLNWLMGWLYVGIGLALTAIGRYLMIRRNPHLMEERATALQRDDTKTWDKLLMPIVAIIGPFAQIIVAGLDFRFDWSPPFTVWIELLGLAFILAGYFFSTWPMLANPFFSATMRVQKEREQQVITQGPYAIVRHPAYMGSILGNIGVPLMLSSLWSVIPTALLMVAIIIRTRLEDDTLQAELEGYTAYAQKTRYRLIPFVW